MVKIYVVSIAGPALEDATVAYEWIASSASIDAADRWIDGLLGEVATLKEMPGRYPAIRETIESEIVYRSVNYYSHRLIYRIDEDTRTVMIVRIYHGARRPLMSSDLES